MVQLTKYYSMTDKIWAILLLCQKNKSHNIHIEQEIIEILWAKTFYSPMFLFNKWRDYVNTKHIIHTDALSVTKISFQGGESEAASVNNICKTSSVCDQNWGNERSNVATVGEDGMCSLHWTQLCRGCPQIMSNQISCEVKSRMCRGFKNTSMHDI